MDTKTVRLTSTLCGGKMDTEKVKKLKEQIRKMEKTPTNLVEAVVALYSIIEKLTNQVNDIQRELDDWDNYRMEQNERNA